MRRIAVLSLILFVLAPLAAAEDDARAKRSGLTPEQAARLILEGSDGQQALVAQYLERADAQTLAAVQKAIRERARIGAPAAAKRAPAKRKPGPRGVKKGTVRLVNLETRILQTKPGTGDSASILRDIVTDRPSDNVGMLTPKQLEALLKFVERDERVSLITAPRLTVYDTQRANVSVLNQVSYVQDFDVEVQGEEWVADPVVGIVQEGLVMDLRPVISKDGRYVTVSMNLTWADLQKPIPAREVILRKGTPPVTIQFPQIDVGSSNATVTIPEGHAAVLASPNTFGSGDESVQCLAVVTATPLTMEGSMIEEFLGEEIELVPADSGPRPAVKKQPAPAVKKRRPAPGAGERRPPPAPVVGWREGKFEVTPADEDKPETGGMLFEDVPPKTAVRLDLRALEMSAANARRLLPDAIPTAKQAIFPISGQRAQQILRLVQRRRDVRVRDRARAVIPLGQTLVLDDTIRESYIQDFDVEVVGSGAHIADPIIGTLVDGVTLEASARLRKDDMALYLKGTWGAVLRPIPTFETRLKEGGKTVTIQLPELRLQQAAKQLSFKGEGWWIVHTRVAWENGRRETVRPVLVHAKRTTYSQPRLGDG